MESRQNARAAGIVEHSKDAQSLTWLALAPSAWITLLPRTVAAAATYMNVCTCEHSRVLLTIDAEHVQVQGEQYCGGGRAGPQPKKPPPQCVAQAIICPRNGPETRPSARALETAVNDCSRALDRQPLTVSGFHSGFNRVWRYWVS